MTAREQFEEQKRLDRIHHEGRVEWLSVPCPLYADGTPVQKDLALRMLKLSESCLADPTGMTGYNSYHHE